jgi:hypothetical protein
MKRKYPGERFRLVSSANRIVAICAMNLLQGLETNWECFALAPTHEWDRSYDRKLREEIRELLDSLRKLDAVKKWRACNEVIETADSPRRTGAPAPE